MLSIGNMLKRDVCDVPAKNSKNTKKHMKNQFFTNLKIFIRGF